MVRVLEVGSRGLLATLLKKDKFGHILHEGNGRPGSRDRGGGWSLCSNSQYGLGEELQGTCLLERLGGRGNCATGCWNRGLFWSPPRRAREMCAWRVMIHTQSAPGAQPNPVGIGGVGA